MMSRIVKGQNAGRRPPCCFCALAMVMAALAVSAWQLGSPIAAGAEEEAAPSRSAADEQEVSKQDASSPNKPVIPSGTRKLEQDATILNEGERPSWVGRTPFREGGDEFLPVSGDMASTKEKAVTSLYEHACLTLRQYAVRSIGQREAAAFVTPADAKAQLEQNIFVDEIVSPTFGKVYQAHGLIHVSPQFTAKLEQIRRRSEQADRVAATSVLSAGLFAVMGLAAWWLGRHHRGAQHRPWTAVERPVGMTGEVR